MNNYSQKAYLLRQNKANINNVVVIDIDKANTIKDNRVCTKVKTTNKAKVARQLVDNEKKHIKTFLYECNILEVQKNKAKRQNDNLEFLKKIGRR
jgi:hypothetical protein